MKDTAEQLKVAIAAIADPDVAVTLQRYFKTGPGEYGEGDIFAGVRVPAIHIIARQFATLPLSELDELLASEIHEHRAAALQILVSQFKQVSRARNRDDAQRERISEFYVAAVRRQRVNNWDLVDGSAEFILGEFLFDKPRDLLFDFAGSERVWERRVAVLSTFSFIKHGDASTSLEIANLLLTDKHPLIHKAVGWMLRDLGGRIDRQILLEFLDKYAPCMPRTMLSYATEHLDPAQREYFRSLKRVIPKMDASASLTVRAGARSNIRVD